MKMLSALAQDADIMVYDAAYTNDEVPNFKGWGHSTWQEALKVADAANVKQTFFFTTILPIAMMYGQDCKGSCLIRGWSSTCH